MNKTIVKTIGGPIEIESNIDYAHIKIDGVGSSLSASDARTVAGLLNAFADTWGAVKTKPVRDPHSLLLVLVECMSTFDDNDPASIERTQAALLEYERSGDHNHGQGPIAPGGACSTYMINCWVGKVRAELAALKKVK